MRNINSNFVYVSEEEKKLLINIAGHDLDGNYDYVFFRKILRLIFFVNWGILEQESLIKTSKMYTRVSSSCSFRWPKVRRNYAG
jgi:hypothetical protein